MLRVMLSLLGYAAMALMLLVVGYISWGFYQSYEVRKWDAKIEALCAANDGKDVEARVYETVMAPETPQYLRGPETSKSMFVPYRSEGMTLGPEFPYVMENELLEVLNDANPRVVKYVERIVRVSDKKVLGERVRYQRAGGGMPGPDPAEIRNCPRSSLTRRLEPLVFLNYPQRAELENQ